MDDSDYENELNDFQNNGVQNRNVTKAAKTVHIVANECTIRRDIEEANKHMMSNTMHEWTNAIDYLTTGERQITRKVDMVQGQGKTSKWERHKRVMEESDDMCMEISKAIYPDTSKQMVAGEKTYKKELATLQKEREVRARHEQAMAKGRMKSKIKAKGFHRHERKRDMKQFMVREGDMENEATRHSIDRMRAEERMTLKHKKGGKFARLSRLRAKYDERARGALEAMRAEGADLTRKDDDMDGSEEEEEDMDDSMEEDDGSEDSCEEVAMGDASMPIDARKDGSALIQREGGRTETARLVEVDRPMLFSSSLVDGDEDDDEVTGDRGLFIDAAVGEEELAEFARQKAELVASERRGTDTLDTHVAGWGGWTGAGLEGKDHRLRTRGLVNTPAAVASANPRKDHAKPRVWIRQGVHDGLKKHLVKTIPYPYNTVQQFELSRKPLVSGAFTLETVHRRLTQPAAPRTAGKPIYPVQRAEKERHK